MRHFIKIPHICILLYRKYSESEAKATASTASIGNAGRTVGLYGSTVFGLGGYPVGHDHYDAQCILIHIEDFSLIGNLGIYYSTVCVYSERDVYASVEFLALKGLRLVGV